jgi:hypothetical protein
MYLDNQDGNNKYYRIVLVSFAGRKCTMSILMKYIEKYKNKNTDYFDEYRIFVATTIKEDLDYLESLNNKFDWINLVYTKKDDKIILDDRNYIWDASYKTCCQEDTVYLKFDDDIIFLEENIFTDFIKFRIRNKEHPLVFPAIINNSFTSWYYEYQKKIEIHPTLKTKIGETWIDTSKRIYPYVKERIGQQIKIGNITETNEVLCPVAWGNLDYVVSLHNMFINDIKNNNNNNNNDKYKFHEWRLKGIQPVSISCCCWLGDNLKKYTSMVGEVKDDEPWWTIWLPVWTGDYNIIYGKTVVGHYAYYKQRELGLDKTDILEKYDSLFDYLENNNQNKKNANQKIMIAYCDPSKKVGGFGDRILGIISMKYIADLIGSKFLIYWSNDKDLKPYFNYDKYDATNHYTDEELVDMNRVNHMSSDIFIYYLKNISNLNDNLFDVQLLPVLGINYILYLYQNKNYKNKLPKYDILLKEIYSSFLKEVFIPKQNILNKIPKQIKNKSCNPNNNTIIVGLQFRCGDKYMDIIGYDKNMWTDVKIIKEIVNNLLKIIFEKYESKYDKIYLFLTTDYYKLYDYINQVRNSVPIYKKFEILYDNRNIIHIDLSSNKKDIDKLYSDFISLTMCDDLYITYDSNLGRISSLMNLNLYNQEYRNIIHLPRKNLSLKGISTEKFYKLSTKKPYNDDSFDDSLWNKIITLS